ncbi:DUF4132 domain-containing protein [Kitasatospora sp. LaBMicrA B282]|uniref:DUF4132 domain-containing protein n=1 Tax=Kitasatospora sp. LaBMicrA B282 TaxID=3420949 RepID=UPI003D0B24C3
MPRRKLVGDESAETWQAPDEETFVLPAAWHDLVQPRRGGLVGVVPPADPAAVDRAEEWLARDRKVVEALLTDPQADPELVRLARANLAGTADPLGAAVLAALAPPYVGHSLWSESPFVDAWVVRHGLAFAARAVVELCGIDAGRFGPGVSPLYRPLRLCTPLGSSQPHLTAQATDRVRALLAAADEEAYRQAVAALAEYRTTPHLRVVTAYLAPGTPGWAEGCLLDQPGLGAHDHYTLRPLLLRALDDPAQVSRVAPSQYRPYWSMDLIATLTESLGAGCVPLVAEAVAGSVAARDSDRVRIFTAALVEFPTDDALQVLLARLDDKRVRPAVQDAMERYPVRATRLLAAAALRGGKIAPTARRLLATHLTRHPAVLPELLPHLDQAAADLLRALDPARPRVAEAPPEELPPLLVSPPWTRKRTARKPRVLTGLRPDDAARVRWEAGEHGIDGGLLLVPDAVGPVGAARQAAEQALRLVAADVGATEFRAAVADRYGAEAAELVAELLATDPLEATLPGRLPALPGWVQPGTLPQLLLNGSGTALPEAAVRHVLTMLAISKPGAPYPGLAVVREACRDEALAEFAWELFQEWRLADLPAKESWILHALGFLGNDETVRRLTPIVRDWPGEGAHRRAVEGLDVLAGIGTDVALLHLNSLAQRVKFKALKERAQEKITEIADGLGLSGEQLADRLVPDLGLDAAGTTVIDYGPRRFTVGFDEQLRPFVLDGDGKRRKDLPAPGARDDQELAPAERKRFAGLKKDVRTIATDQIRRLEAAMVAQRSWTAGEFRELFVRHPLLGHLVRRLVWVAEGTEDATAFRVAEDRTFADLHDDAFTLPDGATVRLAHPLLLGETLPAWSELVADYQILQPFPQLGRPVHRLTPEEATDHRLRRFEEHVVPVGRLLALTKRGWERGAPQDAGIERWFSKPLGDGVHLVIALEDGLWVGNLDESAHQLFRTVWLDRSPGDYRPAAADRYPLRFGDLDPVTASELLADLAEATAEEP